jgi:hypothetical protein
MRCLEAIGFLQMKAMPEFEASGDPIKPEQLRR